VGVNASVLSDSASALIALAATIATGDVAVIEAAVADARRAGVPSIAIDELVLQSVLTVGWPRALVAAGICRAAIGAESGDRTGDLDYDRHHDWTARGEATCRIIYGDHYDKLRANVRNLHPALEAWMITEGYGRTLSRPGLDLKTRELCTVAQTAVLRTPRQLHSHLLGALRAGASADELTGTLNATRQLLSASEWDEVVLLWNRVRDAQARTP
jgi:4-carboxymuconolactone decarboxylase